MLTDRENVLEVVRRGNPDRFASLFDAFVPMRNPITSHKDDPKKGDPDKRNAWGVMISWRADQPGPFPVHKPGLTVMPDIEQWREVVKAPTTEYSETEWEPYIALAEDVDRTQKFVQASVSPGIFEQIHALGGMDNILLAFYESPDELKELIKYILEYEMKMAEKICHYIKPDALFHHDDWGSDVSTFFSADMFAEFFEEPYKQLYSYYHDHGVELVIHHSDTYGATLVPTMINMGIDIWQGAVANNDIPSLIKQYGDKITIMGGLDSTKLDVPEWSNEAIHDEVFKVCAENGPLSFIPCLTRGGAGSIFPGVYDYTREAIKEFSDQYFANKA